MERRSAVAMFDAAASLASDDETLAGFFFVAV
jgi:hypothetical protein